MDFEIQLISMLLKEKSVNVLKDIIEAGDIWKKYRNQFAFIQGYFLEYGVIPDAQTFLIKYNYINLSDYPEPAEFYIKTLKEMRFREQLREAQNKLKDYIDSNKYDEALDLLHKANSDLTEMKSIGKDIDYANSIDERIARYDNRQNNPGITGVSSGWYLLDSYTTGWQPGEFNVLFGKSKSFKTFILLQWALNAWKSGKRVLFYTREVQAATLQKRLDAILTQVPYNNFKKGFSDVEEYEKFKIALREAIKNGPDVPFEILDVSGVSGTTELDYLSSKVKMKKPDILFVDGIYLITGQGKSEWEKVKNVTNTLKQMAISLSIPIVGTTQATKKSKAHSLTKEDLAYAPSFEQDCDYMFSINRKIDPVTESLTNYLEIRAEASRDGEEFSTACFGDFIETSFNELSMEELTNIMGDYNEEQSDRPF